jgi:hypothetical protein
LATPTNSTSEYYPHPGRWSGFVGFSESPFDSAFPNGHSLNDNGVNIPNYYAFHLSRYNAGSLSGIIFSQTKTNTTWGTGYNHNTTSSTFYDTEIYINKNTNTNQLELYISGNIIHAIQIPQNITLYAANSVNIHVGNKFTFIP